MKVYDAVLSASYLASHTNIRQQSVLVATPGRRRKILLPWPDTSENLLDVSESIPGEQPAQSIRDVPWALGTAQEHTDSHLRRHGRGHLFGDGLVGLPQHPRRFKLPSLQVTKLDSRPL